MNPAQRLGSANAGQDHQNNRGRKQQKQMLRLPIDTNSTCTADSDLCTDEWSSGRQCGTFAYCIGGDRAGRSCRIGPDPPLGRSCPGTQGDGICNAVSGTCDRGLRGIACTTDTGCNAPAFCHDGCAFCD